jgi:hypothetical protein
MDLDLLDETYPMGKFNLPFKDSGQGGLTGLVGRSNWVYPDLLNLGVNSQMGFPVDVATESAHRTLPALAAP